MVCRVSDETTLTMLVVQARGRRDGMFLVLVPNNLDAGQVQEGMAEIGVEPQQVMEVSGWERAGVGLAMAFLPYPTRD